MVDRGGVRSSVQVAVLGKYGVSFQHEEVGLGEDEGVDNGVLLCLVVLPPARLPSWMCPVVVGDICEFENHPVPECYSPPRIR